MGLTGCRPATDESRACEVVSSERGGVLKLLGGPMVLAAVVLVALTGCAELTVTGN